MARKLAARLSCCSLSLALGCRPTPDAELEAPSRATSGARLDANASARPSASPSSSSHAREERPASKNDTAGPSLLPPLGGDWLEELGPAAPGSVVTLPLGAREPRPLLVAVHGAGDRPEWSCGGFRLATDAKTFVLCPRGSKLDPTRFAWASSEAIERALSTALGELQTRYARYLARGPAIYAGFSQGATLAEPILRARAAQFPIALLAEGGYAFSQSAAFARAYHDAGGRRIALVCGSVPCLASAARAKKVLERANLQALVIGDALAGHNLNERMQVALRKAWPEISAPLP